ncbi:hypothetical protein Tco_0869530 [Tanacetum coccineum]
MHRNLIDLRVKVIRCDNRTEFQNRVMNQFCERKGIKRYKACDNERSPELEFKPSWGGGKKVCWKTGNKSGNPNWGMEDSGFQVTEEPDYQVSTVNAVGSEVNAVDPKKKHWETSK